MTSSLPRSVRAGATALAATAALGLAACGGSSGGDSPDGPLDRAALAKQLTTICTDSAAKAKDLDAPSDPAKYAGYLDDAVPLAGDLVARMEKLRPAPDAKADFDKLLSAQRTSLAALKRAQAKIEADGANGTEALEILSDVIASAPQAAQAAQSLGVDCG